MWQTVQETGFALLIYGALCAVGLLLIFRPTVAVIVLLGFYAIRAMPNTKL